MARQSILVYNLLRSEQPSDGYSQKDILTRLSSKYDIRINKTLRRGVVAALRCGLDFGILVKKGNKFRFESNLDQTASLKRNSTRRGSRTRKRNINSKKKVTNKPTSTKPQGQRQRRRRRRRSSSRDGDGKKSVPRPILPKPPSWSPQKRKLTEEPISKFIKHS